VSGCGCEGVVIAEGFELPDVAEFAGVGVGGAAGGVVGAEVMELCVRVLQEVPDDDEDGTSDGGDGAFLAPPLASRRWRSPKKVSVLPAPTASPPRTREITVECLRILRAGRTSAVKARTAAINQIKGPDNTDLLPKHTTLGCPITTAASELGQWPPKISLVKGPPPQ
jgi:hypothetical protein